jgi:Fe-S oxidoreductase
VAAALEARGYDVFLPEGQACCGIPALYVGDRETAITLARQNVEALAAAPADLIVTACPTCHVALTRHFAELLDGPDAERAAELAAKTRDFSQLAGEHPLPGDQATRVTYHDPCHLRRGVGIWREPRAALQSSGYELVEMAHPDECCGFAGSFSLSCPAVSRRILERKLDQIAATGAEIVATDCPGCLLQLRGGLAKTGSPITVCHTAELLARALTKVPADTEKKPVP